MLWSSWYFFSVMTVGFVAMKLFASVSEAQSINPGYWQPTTLFDLNSQTGGYGIEDAFFMFFIGGIAAVLFEELFRKRIRYRALKHRPHKAILLGVLGAAVVAATGINLIYAVIAFGYIGATVIWYQRPDLIQHSLLGGTAFLITYIACYASVILLYPGLIEQQYNLNNISGVLLLGIPLEEYLFAFGLGLMWSPIYEYVRDVKE